MNEVNHEPIYEMVLKWWNSVWSDNKMIVEEVIEVKDDSVWRILINLTWFLLQLL